MLNPNAGPTRRNMVGMVAGTAALAASAAAAQSPQSGGVNRNSAPSQLRITDMRAIRIASNYDYPIIRIDTNQGVYGLGEARDAGNEGMALVLKPHIVGRNPLEIEPILDRIRNFTNQRRFGGGYSALDIALHDIAGKVYGVPAWRLVGSQYRSRVRCYCDTTESSDPKVYAARMAARKKMGVTFGVAVAVGIEITANATAVLGKQRSQSVCRPHGRPQEDGVYLFQDGYHALDDPQQAWRAEYARRGDFQGTPDVRRAHSGRARCHRLGSAAGSRSLRPSRCQRRHPPRPLFRTVRTRLGRGSPASGHARFRGRSQELARLQGD